MVVDTIGKAASKSEDKKIECKASAASLNLEPDYSLLDSVKATCTDNQDFSKYLYYVVS